jgi:hypothetical protein
MVLTRKMNSEMCSTFGGGGIKGKNKQGQHTDVHLAMWGYVLVLMESSTTQNYISGDCSITYCNKHKTQTQVIIPLPLYPIFISHCLFCPSLKNLTSAATSVSISASVHICFHSIHLHVYMDLSKKHSLSSSCISHFHSISLTYAIAR